jgi:hypothetical protein
MEREMGQAKHEAMRLEDLDAIATGIAIKAKAVDQCFAHSDVTINNLDDDANRHAFALATKIWQNGEIAVDCTREELMAAIKNAIDNSGDECASCAKIRDE